MRTRTDYMSTAQAAESGGGHCVLQLVHKHVGLRQKARNAHRYAGNPETGQREQAHWRWYNWSIARAVTAP